MGNKKDRKHGKSKVNSGKQQTSPEATENIP